jgi:ribosomal protein S18 acetylase RimI-like enzyme
MEAIIRRALEEDAGQIAALRDGIWTDQTGDISVVQQALRDPQHVTDVAVHSGKIVGFVDGFQTHTQVGLPRWEVDLLAVHPEFRGQRLGERLVRSTVAAGQLSGAAFARALIQISNLASQRTFSRCTFQPENGTCNLYLWSRSSDAELPKPDWLHLVPVHTLNYRGLWMEGGITREGFAAAQAARQKGDWDVVGAVVPAYLQESNQAALDAGFEKAAEYQWWYYNMEENSSVGEQVSREEDA